MATSDIAICNMALSRIGISTPIAALDESSVEAQLCNQWFEVARDATIYDFDWPFCSKRTTLGLVEEDPNDDWAYSYRLPADCLRARRLVDGTGHLGDDGAEFEISGDDSGGLLLTDEATATLLYSRSVTNPAFFPPAFAMALAWRLAVEIAPALSRKESVMQTCWQAYALAIAGAASAVANESRGRKPGDASSIVARG